jgi:predicted PurR-regulated permease PerM
MRNLIFNSNTLQFQESGIEKKITKLYGTIIPLVIFIFVIFYSNSIVNSQLNDTINRLNSTIKEKNKQIKSLQTPYSNKFKKHILDFFYKEISTLTIHGK